VPDALSANQPMVAATANHALHGTPVAYKSRLSKKVKTFSKASHAYSKPPYGISL